MTGPPPGAFDLLVIGDANPDVLVSGAPETPPAGQAETLVDGGTLALGGSAAIVAHGAARLGLSTALVALVGRDPAGDFVLDVLSAAGVETRFCTRHESLPTALTVCLNRPDGDRAILTALGCLAAFGPEHVPDMADVPARHVHAASYFLQPSLAAGLPGLFAAARAAGASTSLDTNDDPAGEWRLAPGLLAGCDLLFPNEAEARALAGALGAADRTLPDDPPAAALVTLAAAGPTPVVKLGRRGAVAATPTATGAGADAGVKIMSARGPEVAPIDTVGAGDSFDAGFLAGWLAAGDLAEGLAWGCACGALSTGAVGGTAAQPGRGEAASLAARIKVTEGR